MVRKLMATSVAISAFLINSIVVAESPLQTFSHVQPEVLSARSAAGLEIPPVLGILISRHLGSGDRVVIHIQDSHGQFEAQQNISKLIQYFAKNFPTQAPRLVLVEGGEGLIDTSPLAAVEDQSIRDKIATYFLKEGLITGAEYYSIMSREEALLVGADDRKLYLENLAYFRACQSQKLDMEMDVERMIRSVEGREEKVFSAELLRINRLRKLYEKGDLALGQYCQHLREHWQGSVEVLYPNLFRMIRISEHEANIQSRFLRKELYQLISSMRSRLDRKELERLVQKSLLHRLGKLDRSLYFYFVYDLARRLKIDFQIFPNLSHFFAALEIRRTLDLSRVHSELESMDRQIRSGLYRSGREEELDEMDRFLNSLNRLAHLELSSEGFKFYLQQKERFSLERILKILNSDEARTPLSIGKAQKAVTDLEAFYHVALKRDAAILKNVLKRMEEEESKVSILITGGFHTPGMMEGFRKGNVSYCVIAPKVSAISDFSIYLSSIMDVTSSLDRDLRTLALRLASPIRFAVNPFGDGEDWERIIGKALLFKDFLEKARGSKGETLIESYTKFVNERLAVLKRPDGTPRFTQAELRERIDRLRYVVSHLRVDWGKVLMMKDAFLVPVYIKDKMRVVRVTKGKPIPPVQLEYEEVGQLDKDVSFSVLPEKYTEAYQLLLGAYSVSGAELERVLTELHPREIAGLASIFSNVKVVDLKRVHRMAWQFSLFKRMSLRRFTWVDGILQSYDFNEDLLTSVQDVEVVETIRRSKQGTSLLERHYDLVHATSLAVRRMRRWLSDTGSKFVHQCAFEESTRWLRAYLNSLDWLNGRGWIRGGGREKMAALQRSWERLGRGEEKVDIFMHGIELAKGVVRSDIQGSVSVVSFSEPGGFVEVPDLYLRKLVAGPHARRASVDVTQPLLWNLERLSETLAKPKSALKGAILLRPRHKKLVRDLLRAGISIGEPLDPWDEDAFEAFWKKVNTDIQKKGLLELGNLTLMSDGDLMAVLGLVNGKIDFLLGAGGAHEGVMSAAVVEAIGGNMSAQLCAYDVLQESAEESDLERDFEKYTPREIEQLAQFGFARPGMEKEGEVPWNKVWNSKELVPGSDVVVIASALKNSPWVDTLKAPVINSKTGNAEIYSVVVSRTGRIRVVKVTYDLGIRELRRELDRAKTEQERVTLSLEWVEILESHGFYPEALQILQVLESAVEETGLKLKVKAAMAYLEGMIQLVEGAQLEGVSALFEKGLELDPLGSSEARRLLIQLYSYLAEEALKRENREQAIFYFQKALERARSSGFKNELKGIEERLSNLGVSTRKLGIPEEEARKLLVLQMQWNEDKRPPVALIYAGRAEVENLEMLQQLIQEGLRSGDGVFLGGELAYAFLKYREGVKTGIHDKSPVTDLVSQMIQEATELPVEHAFRLRNGIILYFPLDHVYSEKNGNGNGNGHGNGNGIGVVTDLAGQWIPESTGPVDIGERTAYHYQRKFTDFSFFVAMGLLGKPGVYIHGTKDVLMSLVDKAEMGQSVYFIGNELAAEASVLGISDREGVENQITGLFHVDTHASQILTGQPLEGDIFLGGIRALLEGAQVDIGVLAKFLSSLDEGKRLIVLRMFAKHILEQLVQDLITSVGEDALNDDVRFKNVFGSNVLARFAWEGPSREALTRGDIQKMIAENPLGVFEALVFEGTLDEKSSWPFFYLFLNGRDTQLANLLTSYLYIAHDPCDRYDAEESFQEALRTERVLRETLLERAA